MRNKNLDKAYECIYNCIYIEIGEMLDGPIRWNALKNIRLKFTRRVSFEEIIKSELLGFGDNPSRSHQKVLIYRYKNYTWAVPLVFDGRGIFLKTIYPSRKYKKVYEKGEIHEKRR
ncbi:MAG: toxin [Candidatus Omnitrophota bacterium]